MHSERNESPETASELSVRYVTGHSLSHLKNLLREAGTRQHEVLPMAENLQHQVIMVGGLTRQQALLLKAAAPTAGLFATYPAADTAAEHQTVFLGGTAAAYARLSTTLESGPLKSLVCHLRPLWEQDRAAKAPLVSCHILLTHAEHALLIQRGVKPLKGWWGLPGGVVEPGEHLAQAVKRELKEETGIQLKEEPSLIGLMEWMIEQEEGTVHYVTLLYHAGVSSMAEAAAGDDARAARWFTAAELTTLRLTDMAHKMLESQELLSGPMPDLASEFTGKLTVVMHEL